MKNQRFVVAAGAAGWSIVSLAGSAPGQVQPSAAMLRYPDVGKDSICFVYANDIWLVPKAGGTASPLASPPGAELFPRFSPDGKTIAFVGNYEGNRDLYTIPAAGGVPTRVTYHPGSETLSEWTPEGRLLYMTNAFAGLARQTQLWTVGAGGGLPAKTPVPYGGFGSISPDGAWLAYTPHSTDSRTWKRYRGGMATDVWLFNLRDNTSRRVTDWEGTDTIPMFVPGGDGRTVYFLSDAGPEHRLNLWSYDIAGQKKEQVTKHTGFDVRWPSIGPGAGKGEVVYQLGSELRLLDLGSKKDTVVTVTIPGDRPTLKPRQVDAAKNINSAGISPSGKRVVIEGRGDLWTAPAKEGVTRNLTRTDGVFEREPAWSPDGKLIAYFSDESGEYELWVRGSDAREAEKKDEGAKSEGADKKTDESAGAEQKTDGNEKAGGRPVGKAAEPRKLTSLGAGFRSGIAWSPDSKSIAFTDNAGNLHLCTVESGETKLIDTDPWSGLAGYSWSSDSGWLAYGRNDEGTNNGCIWLYETKSGQKTRVTAPMFNSVLPTFDRKGDVLYFRSNRAVNSPVYSDMDTSFVYTGTQQLYMVPLRDDVKNPFAVRCDEEELKADEKKEDEKDEKKDQKDGDGEKKDDAKPADDGIGGSWEGKATGNGEGFPAEGVAFTMTISLAADGKVSGSVNSPLGGGPISGTYDKGSGKLTITFLAGEATITMTGTFGAGEGSGTWQSEDGGSGNWTCKRTTSGAAADDDSKKDGEAKDKAKEVKIDLDGFERRAILVPVAAGAFGDLGVTHDHKLIYVRQPARGGGEAGIKIFDPSDETKEEKAVVAGGGFSMSDDGKKLLVRAGGAMTVYDASAGGGKGTTVPTTGMMASVDPRDEWKQIFSDVYRFERDYFYEPTLHGVDWAGLKDHYARMLQDCVSREDVAFVLAEYISELNVGHAYVTNPGDVEQAPSVPGGLLGCDFELVGSGANAAYRISAIHEGAAWDADGRGPLSQPGIDVKAGEYLLAVNGVPVDTSKDPWAALVGTANRPTQITVGPNAVIDDQAREYVVKPLESEVSLRFRSWIERNRTYVSERTSGRVGYAYVPNTGVDGQNELFRQFYGQRDRDGMIIDERWNGGGQIPTRFIELLNRPATNYWRVRHGNDWSWPPDAHFGPKCMLINGLAGSGGDMFPWLFKHNGIGKTIGTRTWGGLVGISGNPGLIDGGYVTVPTFGFYETDGTWGVEGHGVDPDIEVIDDPAKMVRGGDPQLDAAIDHMLGEIEKNGFHTPTRPQSPNRKGMGIRPEDR